VSGKGEFNSLGQPMRPGEEVVRVESVEVVTLDDYCRERAVGAVDLVKIDVEGAELWVVRGAAALLGQPAAPVLVCEFNERTAAAVGSSCRELRRVLEAHGYRLFAFDAQRRRIDPEPEGERYERSRNLIAAKQPAAVQALLAPRLT
jgi:hypothetical protein